MNADSIVSMLLNLNQETGLKPEDGEALLLRYPYFEAGRFALLRKLREQGDYRFQEQLKQSAVHCSDRKALYHFVERQAGEVQNTEPLKVAEEVLAASTADDLSESTAAVAPIGDSAQTLEFVQKSEERTPDAVVSGHQETERPSAKNTEEQLEKEQPSVWGSPGLVTPETEKAAQTEQTSVANAPTQRKPRINWNPDQAIEAPNDILSQILAYPELGKVNTQEERKESTEEKVSPLTEPVEKKLAEEPRRFTEWLKATQSGAVRAGQTTQPTTQIEEVEVRPAPKASFFNPIEMARRSVEDRDDLVTETLARVYLNQGDTTRALRIYHKLSLLYPEKSAYFAALVEKIVKPS